MMTKTTSQTKAILKKIAIIPFIFGLIYFLCFKTVAQENNVSVKVQTGKKENPTMDRRDEYYAGVRVIFKDFSKKTIIDKQYEELTSEEKDKYVPAYVPTPFIEKSPSKKEFESFKDSNKFAIWMDGVHKPNEYLNNFKPMDIVFFQGSSVSKNARSKKFPQPFQYNFYTKDYFDKNLKNSWKKFGGKEIITTQNCADKWDKTNNFREIEEKKETVKIVEKNNEIAEKPCQNTKAECKNSINSLVKTTKYPQISKEMGDYTFSL